MNRPTCAGMTRATVLLLALAPLGLSAGPLTAAAAADGCAFTNSRLDLNGDGFDDAVVGNPYATVNGKAEAGSVTVLFGDADGRIGEGVRRVLTQAGVPGSNVEAGDRFGWSVSINDVTADGCADLLIGSPGEDWQGHPDAGIAHLISYVPDAEGGPGTPQAILLDQGDVVGAQVETGDQFGYTVSAGSGDGDDSVAAVGAPGEDVGSAADAGEVDALRFAGNSLSSTEQLRQGRGNIPGTPEAGDRFGAALVVTQLEWLSEGTSRPRWSLLVGTPGDTVNGRDGAGSVAAVEFYGRWASQYDQDSPGVPGTAEAGDQFGFSLAISQWRGFQGFDRWVAVGAPGEDLGRTVDAGSATLLVSEDAQLTPRSALTQDTAGVGGSPEPGDHFGHAVAFRPDSTLLAIGVPDEDLGCVSNAGLVQTFDLPSTREEPVPGVDYAQDSTGVPGLIGTGHRFGLSAAGMSGVREDLVAVGSPIDGSGSVFLVSSGNPGGPQSVRSWVPGRGGIPSTTGRFGWSIGGLASQA